MKDNSMNDSRMYYSEDDEIWDDVPAWWRGVHSNYNSEEWFENKLEKTPLRRNFKNCIKSLIGKKVSDVREHLVKNDIEYRVLSPNERRYSFKLNHNRLNLFVENELISKVVVG